MASSKEYVDDGVLVPQAILDLSKVNPGVYVNRPPEQRLVKPAYRSDYYYRVFIDEPMRRYLKTLTQLPKQLLLHFRGYGRQVGTVIIELKSIYWTIDDDQYCRLDFKHPEEMGSLNGCPNFWGAFILAIAPVSESRNFCAADPDGSEFVRLYREIGVQDVGVEVGSSTSDLDELMPEHPVCTTLVEVPTVRLQPKGLNCRNRPTEFEGQVEIVVQWYGDDNGGELSQRNLQFAFPLITDPDAIHWFGHPEWYRTAMLGPLKNWPNKDALAQMIREGRSAESTIIYVMTARLGMDDGRGGCVPSALIVGVVSLGDPIFGVIRPRPYTNMVVSEEEIAKLRRVRR